MEILTLSLVVALSVVAFQSWVIYLLARQHGRALVAQDELASRITAAESTIERLNGALPSGPAAPSPAPGLRLDEPAPGFTLPNLAGHSRSLSDFLGKPTVVIFFNPDCGYCLQLGQKLGQLPADAPPVVVMSRGDHAANLRLATENGWRTEVLLEPGWEVATAYRTNATPTGYLINAEGRIASALAAGVDDVLKLVHFRAPDSPRESADPALTQKKHATEDKARSAGLRTRPLTESRLQRDGLPAGTLAPDFTLPDLNGADRSLSEFRGRRVLLVFSDPGCGPCQTLAPLLEDLHTRRTVKPLDVLMVSRGDVAVNREKAREHGLTFPVLIQNSWEISRQYAMFATPIAYLIDEHGVIVSDVAVGTEAILRLERPFGDRAEAFAGVASARR